MRRYLDDTYQDKLVRQVFEMFDSRAFKFVSLACFKQFQKQMRLLKK